ncbi:PREDICTED: translation initiation factor IF-2-like [Rhinopithecus bieti]|uniref:translation initiation factor IF-2-like n=1 Tax=Rhinopithecus bieti TaxID=61621 RepID=UPI00083C544F|nr:PREDICTED: translation initiation factor IF-2-like [Rhinopithecus bieti]
MTSFPKPCQKFEDSDERGKLSSEKRSSSAAAGRPKPKARRVLGDPLGRIPPRPPRALRSYAARRGEEAGDRGEGCPRTRTTSLGLDGAPGRAPASASRLRSAPAAPAFCFTRGTTNAAAAMLTTEPGGGARSRRAECGCAGPADGALGRDPEPPPRARGAGALSPGRECPQGHRRVAAERPRSAPGAPTPSWAPGFLPRPGCAWLVVASAVARLGATFRKSGVHGGS